MVFLVEEKGAVNMFFILERFGDVRHVLDPCRGTRYGRGMAGGKTKNPHAVALGRLGGRRGGPARRRRLSPETRSFIGQLAVRKRWLDCKRKKFSSRKIAEIEERADRDLLGGIMLQLCRAAHLSPARTEQLMRLGLRSFDSGGCRREGFSVLAFVVKALGGKLRVVAEIRGRKIVLVEH
jgi:hypothetical protein